MATKVPPAANADEETPRAVRGMFDRIAGRYDAANRIMSVGVDALWRRAAVKRVLAGAPAEPRILDLGAGTLDGAVSIARRMPGARVAGVDFARRMLQVGVGKLDDATRLRVAAHQGDALHLPYAAASFDGAFSAFCVRNIPDLDAAFAELRRVLRPGARLVLLEFFRPEKRRAFFDGFWNGRVLPRLGRAVTGDAAAYSYLPASIERFLSRVQAEGRLRAAGFTEVRGRDLFPAGIASLVEAV